MNAAIAKFEKVSFEQFKEDMNKFHKLNDGTLLEYYHDIKLPVRATKGSAGYDFFSPVSFQLDSTGIVIPTGIRCKMEEGWVLQTYPRSGQGFKYGVFEYNTVGIIDQDYYYSDNEGHIMIKLAAREKFPIIERGTAFCQGIFTMFGTTVDDEVNKIRNGGHGSTDKK